MFIHSDSKPFTCSPEWNNDSFQVPQVEFSPGLKNTSEAPAHSNYSNFPQKPLQEEQGKHGSSFCYSTQSLNGKGKIGDPSCMYT
ncbi:Hypothetical predicted protein [Podarcis lilfordi]|uniref:Uncharacterized protein n=1 Tax=Podarcis lilfordi TaxID=74358 RepID=A0AA35P3R8_9SAUR|nr:Hypothetical predicted protein [Podarcis lilfordi]